MSSQRSRKSILSRKTLTGSKASRSILSKSKRATKMTKKYQDEMCERLSKRSECSRKSLRSGSAFGAAGKAKSRSRLGSKHKRVTNSKSKRTLLKTPSVQDHNFHISQAIQSAKKHMHVSALSQFPLADSQRKQYGTKMVDSSVGVARMPHFPNSSFSNQINEKGARSNPGHTRFRSTTKKSSMLIL